MNVDEIALSTLTYNGLLREIAGTGPHDSHQYAVADYPATQASLATGALVEAHVSDPTTDSSERRLLLHDGLASVLIAPVGQQHDPLGVLEFRHRTHRRWTKPDIDLARTLADHIGNAMLRMGDAEWQLTLAEELGHRNRRPVVVPPDRGAAGQPEASWPGRSAAHV
jgi:GAF domain-containing protein